MANRLRITDPQELHRLVGLIHDRWLDAEAVTFDSENSTLNIRYLRETGPLSALIGRARFPAFECFLRISHVQSFSVQDQEKVRFYDMNTVRYDPKSMSLELKTGVPIKILAVVNRFDLTVDETDAIVQN